MKFICNTRFYLVLSMIYIWFFPFIIKLGDSKNHITVIFKILMALDRAENIFQLMLTIAKTWYHDEEIQSRKIAERSNVRNIDDARQVSINPLTPIISIRGRFLWLRGPRARRWSLVYDTQWHFSSSMAGSRGTMAHYIMEYRRMASASIMRRSPARNST